MKIGPVGAVAIVSRAALAASLVTWPIAGSAAPSSSAQDPGTADLPGTPLQRVQIIKRDARDRGRPR